MVEELGRCLEMMIGESVRIKPVDLLWEEDEGYLEKDEGEGGRREGECNLIKYNNNKTLLYPRYPSQRLLSMNHTNADLENIRLNNRKGRKVLITDICTLSGWQRKVNRINIGWTRRYNPNLTYRFIQPVLVVRPMPEVQALVGNNGCPFSISLFCYCSAAKGWQKGIRRMVQKICCDEGKLCSVQLSTSIPLTNAISQITFSCIVLPLVSDIAIVKKECRWLLFAWANHIGPLVRAPIQYNLLSAVLSSQGGRLGYTSNLFAYEGGQKKSS